MSLQLLWVPDPHVTAATPVWGLSCGRVGGLHATQHHQRNTALVLDHKTVAVQRHFQAETHQQPLNKGDCIAPCRDQTPLALSSGH